MRRHPMSWWEDWNNHQKPPAPTVHEPILEQKPLLYDHHGKPLVKAREPVGFRPPKEKHDRPIR